MEKEEIRKTFENCLKTLQNNKQFLGIMKEKIKISKGEILQQNINHRIDELFLVYSKLMDISFVEACSEFGINYSKFNKEYEPKSSSDNTY